MAQAEALASGPLLIRFPHLVKNPPRLLAPERNLLGGPTPAAQKADTYNWDTAFGIRFSDANTELRKPGASPAEFAFEAEGASVSGKFGPWQLSGGDGHLLHMSLPLVGGSYTYAGKTYQLAGAQATIELELRKVPQAGLGGHRFAVQADPETPVSVTSLDNLPGNPGFIVKAVITGLLEEWLKQHLSSFTHIFAMVTLNKLVDKDQFQWLDPTALGWAVSAQGATADDSVFGTLCMTRKRSAPDTMQISPNIIPAKGRSGFLISQQRFLVETLMPGVHTMFAGAKPEDFEITADGTTIRNKVEVRMHDVDLSTGTYTPKLPPNQVRITMEAGEIVVRLVKAQVDFSPGIKIMMDYTGYSTLELVNTKDGKQVLNYVEASPPVCDHNVEVEAWVTWTEVAASVLAAVVTLGTGAIYKKIIETITLRVVAIVITLIVTELISNIPAIIDAIAKGEADKLPPVDVLAINAVSPVVWPGATSYKLTSVALNESLQLGGDPNFIE